MIIGVDAGCLGVADERLRVGVYQVSKNLLKNLGKIDKNNKYLLYSFRPIPAGLMNEFGSNTKNILVRPTVGWSKIWLPLQLLREKPDVFLGLNQFMPPFYSGESVVLAYDLAFEFYPQCYPDSMPKISDLTKEAIKNSSRIIAISNSTANDLIKIYHTPREKITVSHLGYDQVFKPQPSTKIEKIKRKNNIGKPYFLFVGSLKMIKNIPMILSGFAEFLRRTRKDNLFVLVGGDFWLDKEIGEIVKKFLFQEKVIFTGYVPTSELPALYSGALAFVSPSLYEGCGMTLIEAMACGCPVITGNISAMPEVVGKAGIFVDPKSRDQIYRALEKIADDKKLRASLAKEGIIRARHFSWQKFATDVLKVIQL